MFVDLKESTLIGCVIQNYMYEFVLLDIQLDELGEVLLVEIKNKVMDKVETVANDDEGKLISKLASFSTSSGLK